MASFLFWNVNRKPLVAEVSILCAATGTDLLAIAEPQGLDLAALQLALQDKTGRTFHFPEINPPGRRLLLLAA